MTNFGVCDCISGPVRRGIGSGLAKYTAFAARRPCISLLLGVLYIFACLPGLTILESKNDERNYYTQKSFTQRATDRVNELFPFDPAATTTFAYFVQEDGKDLFANETLVSAGKVVDELLKVNAADGTTYSQVCAKRNGACEVDSLFHFFDSVFQTEGIALQGDSTMGQQERVAITLVDTCAGNKAWCLGWLPNVEGSLWARDPTVTAVSSELPKMGSLALMMHLHPDLKDASGGAGAQTYQRAQLDAMHGPSWKSIEATYRTADFNVVHFSKVAVSQEGARPGTSEGHLMGVSFMLILIFVCIAIIAPPGAGPQSRILLGLSSMLICLLSLACSLGLCAYVTVPLTSISSLLAFTLLGVAVDDIIVMVHSYDNIAGTPTEDTVEQRIIDSVQASGATITLTSATSFLAFLCAATVDFPAIQYVSVNGAFGVLSIFVLQFTLFLPFFILDEKRRMRDGRCTDCIRRCKKDRNAEQAGPSKLSASMAVGAAKFRSGLLHPVVQVMVCVFFLACSGIGLYGAAEVRTDGDLTSYYMDGSFIVNYFEIRWKYWSSGTPYYLMIQHEGENAGLPSDSRLDEIDNLMSDLEALDCMSGPELHWIKEFFMYVDANNNGTAAAAAQRTLFQGDPDAFGAEVSKFLKADAFIAANGTFVDPSRHMKNIRFEDGRIASSRLLLWYETDFRSQKRYISNFHRTHSIVFPDGAGKDFSGSVIPGVFGINTAIMRAAERDDVMKRIVFSSLAAACTAVSGAVMLLLNPFVGLFLGVLVVCLDAMVLATLILYDAALDLVAFLCLALTIGLVVDYSTHTAHAYMHHGGPPRERLDYAVRTMGMSIISGGGSTFLGIMALAAASSEGFRTFFRVLATAVGLGTFFGVVVSPVILCSVHRCCLFAQNIVGGGSAEQKAESAAVSVVAMKVGEAGAEA